MDDILAMLARYDRAPRSLAAPMIESDVLDFLRPGLISAVKTDSRWSDPLFAYGSDVTYLCENARGERKTLMLWGNTDGDGIMEVDPSKLRPAAEDL